MVSPSHDDDIADATALVEAIRRDDTRTGEELAAIMPNMNAHAVALALARMLAEAADESRACPSHFREWAASAASRGRSS